jgi:hypothetical protein
MPILANPTPFTATDSTDASTSSVAAIQPVVLDPAEQQLAHEIVTLFNCHTEVHSAAASTKVQLKEIRMQLAERLYQMKAILARPGRAGQWSGFLSANQIPRATADRLVGRYRRSIGEPENGLSESILDPTEQEIQKLVRVVWNRVEKKLGSRKAVYQFISGLITTAGLASEVREGGVFVLGPASEQPDVVASRENPERVSTPVTDLLEQEQL